MDNGPQVFSTPNVLPLRQDDGDALRAHVVFYVAAILTAASLIPACGPQAPPVVTVDERDCPIDQYLDESGICLPVPDPLSDTALIVAFTSPDVRGRAWQSIAGRDVTVAAFRTWSNGVAGIASFDFTVELSRDAGTSWTSYPPEVSAILTSCTLNKAYPYHVYGDGVFLEKADGKAHLTFPYALGVTLARDVLEFAVTCRTNASFAAPDRGIRVSLRLNKVSLPTNGRCAVYYRKNEQREIYGTIRPFGEVDTYAADVRQMRVGTESAVPFSLIALGESAELRHLVVDACLVGAYPCPTEYRMASLTRIRYEPDGTAGDTGGSRESMAENGRGELSFDAQPVLLPEGDMRKAVLYMSINETLVADTPFFLHAAFDRNVGVETAHPLPAAVTVLPLTAVTAH